MKICGISDIHGTFIDIPKCDVLCICGDIISLKNQRSIDDSRNWWYTRFVEWVNKQPCNKVIITAGNHDFFLEHAYKNNYLSELKQDLSVRTNGKLVILINEEYVYKDTKFYGCPFIRPIFYQTSKWAFEDDYHGTENPCCYDSIPADTNVLITHDNPHRSKVLAYYVPEGIKYHLYGHWHEGESSEEENLHNCSLLDNMYNIKEDFEIVSIDTSIGEEQLEEEKDEENEN